MRRLLSFTIFGVSFVLLLFFSVTGYAQTFRGAINGSVTDPSGAVVAGASVKAANNATGIVLSTVSTTDGQFSFQDLPLGTYKVSVVAPGFSVGGFGSLNGTRPNQMNWQIDGVDNNDFWHNIPAVNQGGVSGIAGIILPIDSIDEFSAQTQNGPEAGRNAGGTVNLVTKSG